MKQLILIGLFALLGTALSNAERPNLVWIVGEDMGPELGCYGDRYAITPTLDKFAAEGTRFTRCFTHAPVCAPSRSGLITGRYPTSIGSHHMRSKLLAPPPTFTRLLRDAGYFVAWPGKTDFNFDVPRDAFTSTNNWLKTFPTNRPFFAYINFFVSHESQIRATNAVFQKNTARLTPGQRHDPASAPIPPYHPDAPEVRRDLARYYDLCTAVDFHVADVLRELENQNVASNTVVFFFGDHGRGLPRSKRWIYDLATDSHEIHNLIESPLQRAKLRELRRALDQWMRQTKDLGAIPEAELVRRGLVANKRQEYEKRITPLPEISDLDPRP